MLREQLVAEAREAGRNASHNLDWIRKNPEVMLPGKIESAETYLNKMIAFAEAEIENARRSGRTLGLRAHIKGLLVSILNGERRKSKGETA
ncbi:hypothetical protein ACFCW7_00130 [Paenibacillus glucanolyticus]|uniref:hypothetical protein n=1 Tax=Paenibacillus glucanolyticus TaxID=59843 RepID=UPI0035E0CEC7